jgi:nitrogen fixation/metabolism regulation signal transduction histidine kinase
MKLKFQIFWLITGLIILYTVPVTLYYRYLTSSSVDLGIDISIENSLERSLEQSTDQQTREKSENALKRYRQTKSLKKVIINQAVIVSIFALVFIISASMVLAFIFSSRITKPLAGLTQGTKEIAGGDLDYKVSLESAAGYEMKTLLHSFNQMASKLKKTTEELRLAENKATWREVARTIAHEIKNPLTPIKLSAQRLLKKHKEKSEDFDKVINTATQTILCEIDNMERLVEAFHKYAKLPDPVPNRENINTLLEETVALFSSTAKGISFSGDDRLPPVFIDRGQFKETITNIIKNAIEATDESNREIKVASSFENGKICIKIADNGPGIPEDILKKLFVPYFTTKADGNGIGLALAERIIYQHGGRLTYQGKKGEGAVFVIELNPEAKWRQDG